MKHIHLFVLPLILVLLVFSCKKSHVVNMPAKDEYHSGLTAEDSISVATLGNECMSLLKAGKVEQALDMLCEYDDSLSLVKPLSEESRAIFHRKFSVYPVFEYYLSYISFMEKGLNDIKYKVVFGPPSAGSPTISFMFNPVKVDGKWYLSVKNATQDIGIK